MIKCESCLYSRAIISENGHHYTCGLHWKKAKKCIEKEQKNKKEGEHALEQQRPES